MDLENLILIIGVIVLIFIIIKYWKYLLAGILIILAIRFLPWEMVVVGELRLFHVGIITSMLIAFVYLIYLLVRAVVLSLSSSSETGVHEREPGEPGLDTATREQLTTAVAEMNAMLSFEAPYFNNYRLKAWIGRYAVLSNSIPRLKKRCLDHSDLELLERFNTLFKQGETLRTQRNTEYLPVELDTRAAFFDDIEGTSLDQQQRIAIVTAEDNNLVIAGAGSGKTSTIVGRVRYLLHSRNEEPGNILVLSFTNKSAAELQERLGGDIKVSTFHKLGKNILEASDGFKCRVHDVSETRDDLNTIWEQALIDDGFFDAFRRFLWLYPKPFRGESTVRETRDRVRNNRLAGIAMVRLLPLDKKHLHSQEEVRIYNFLVMHQVKFRYEEPYEYPTADRLHSQYMPDFSIYQDGSRIYLEHFGIDRSGNTAPDVPRQKYLEDMQWKRALHKSRGTILIETYSYEIGAQGFEDILRERLVSAGIILRPLSREQVKMAVAHMGKLNYEAFLDLMKTFISLYKSNCITPRDLEAKVSKSKGEKIRNELFLSLFNVMLKGYEEMLARKQLVDFGDMILRAVHSVEAEQYQPSYTHIIIDEFQDMSLGRYRLLKAVRDANPGCILYCVGDDWQSIYRFTGSDISLLSRFSLHFGVTANSKIETTYRFADPVLSLASKFVTTNPSQIPKQLICHKQNSKTMVHFHYFSVNSRREQDEEEAEITTPPPCQTTSEAFIRILDDLDLDAIDAKLNRDIMVLGRYNHDVKLLVSPGVKIERDEESTYLRYAKQPDLNIRFLTVHTAKGLEADTVILANCSSGYYGFPSEVADDPLLTMLMSEPDNMEYAEERRLFYVAMTRARKDLHLIVDSDAPSPFMAELSNREATSEGACPLCIDGKRVLRTSGKGQQFWGCSNFPYGCKWSKKIQPEINLAYPDELFEDMNLRQ